MRILVLGSGTLAASLASRLRKAGHIAGTHQDLDDVAMLRTLALGARVVFLVVPFHKFLDLPRHWSCHDAIRGSARPERSKPVFW